jgi:hypothetical protein
MSKFKELIYPQHSTWFVEIWKDEDIFVLLSRRIIGFCQGDGLAVVMDQYCGLEKVEDLNCHDHLVVEDGMVFDSPNSGWDWMSGKKVLVEEVNASIRGIVTEYLIRHGAQPILRDVRRP